MKNSIVGIALLTLISFSALADSKHKKESYKYKIKEYVSITPEIVPDYKVIQGDKAHFSGTVCLRPKDYSSDYDKKEHDKKKHHKKKHHKKSKDKDCKKISTSSKYKKHEVKFFFPDTNTDVTEQVTVASGKHGLTYAFDSEDIDESMLNRLTVVVKEKDHKLSHLMKYQAKLQRYIALVDDHKWKNKHKKHIEKYLSSLSKKLVKIEKKIKYRLRQDPKIYARLDYPVQVANKVSPAIDYSQMVGGIKFSLNIQNGDTISGEKSKITGSVVNINEHAINGEKNFDYWTAMTVNGETVSELSDFKRIEDLNIEQEFITNKINAGELSQIGYRLYRGIEKKSGHKKGFHYGHLEVRAELKYNQNVLTDTVKPVWENSTKDGDASELILISISDSFGRIEQSSLDIAINGILADGSEFSKSLSLSTVFEPTGEVFNDGVNIGSTSYLGKITLNDLPEGEFEIVATGNDFAGNKADVFKSIFLIDRTPPVISLSKLDDILTNNKIFQITIATDDISPTTTSIWHNGQEILAFSDITKDVEVELAENINTFRFLAVDSSGNTSEINLNKIVLDTIPPQLSNVKPTDGEVLKSLNITVSGVSSEEIAELKINNKVNNLVPSTNEFSIAHTLINEGIHSLILDITDKAGNSTQKTINFEVSLQLLYKDLISVQQIDNSLVLVGAPGAARGDTELEIKTGFFSKVIVTTNADGSFFAEVPPFSELTLYMDDDQNNREESVVINNDLKTILSGLVKDSNGAALPGVIVSMVSSGKSTTTNASGMFTFTDPETGIQKLQVNGGASPLNSEVLRYPTTNLMVNVGVNQNNILENIIYLTPMRAENEIKIENGESAVVTNLQLPDIKLIIPAGATTFPDGSKTGSISVEKISADRTSLPPPSYAQPSHVYALEPSGVTFTEPVEMTFPNENNFPPGLPLYVISKNSIAGSWQIDGAAEVDPSGGTITTLPGQGITHFSDVFLVPAFPKTESFDVSTVGADSYKNSLSRSISVPGYKVHESNFGLKLYYNSQYAFPSPVITNILKVPEVQVFRNEETLEMQIQGYPAAATIDTYQKMTPLKFTARLKVGNIETDEIDFGGTLAEDTVLSFSTDLSSLETGLYPYTASYALHFENLIIQTVQLDITMDYKSCVFYLLEGYKCKRKYKTIHADPTESQSTVYDAIFPDDLVGQISVVNKSKSEFGAGWSVAGLQTIVNPTSNKILINEGDSKLAIFNSQSTIETVKEGEFDSLIYKDKTLFISSPIGELFSYDGVGEFQTVIPPTKSSNVKFYNVEQWKGKWNGDYILRLPYCTKHKASYDLYNRLSSILPLGANEFYFVDGKSSLLKYNGSNLENLITTSLKQNTNEKFYSEYSDGFCNFNSGLIENCTDTQVSKLPDGVPCDSTFAGVSSGVFPDMGSTNGNYSSAKFNRPKSITKGLGTVLVVSDYGNNIIRAIDTLTKEVTLLAGNGKTTTNIPTGAGRHEISIGKPVDAKYDSIGNLYILNESGNLVKIDSAGNVKLLISSNANGIKSSYKLSETYMKTPHGFAIDNENQYIYIADTGNHRVLRVDLVKQLTTTVAGNGTCSVQLGAKSGVNALNANLCYPKAIALSGINNLFVNDSGNKSIRKINFVFEEGSKLTYLAESANGEVLVKQSDDTFKRIKKDGSYILFDIDGKQIESVSTTGLTTRFLYDEETKFISRIIDPIGNGYEFHYSGDNKISSISDHSGRETFLDVEIDGTLSNVTFPDNNSKGFNYNDKGMLISETNQNNDITSYDYSILNKLEMITLSDESTQKFSYGFKDTVLSASLSEDEQALKSVSSDDIQDVHIDGNGASVSVSEDKVANSKTITDDNGKETTIFYNDEQFPIKIIAFDDSYTTFKYLNGDLIEKYSSKDNITAKFDFNERGMLIKHDNGKGEIRTLDYNVASQVIKEKKFSGDTQYWEYIDGKVSKTWLNDLNPTSFEYDMYGNLSKKTTPGGDSVTFIRDSLGNLRETFSPNSSKKTFTYDVSNHLTSVATGVTESDPIGFLTTYEYSKLGALAKITDPNLNSTYFEFDKLGRVIKKVTPNNDFVLLGYDGNGNINFEQDFNGNKKYITYDIYNRIIEKELADNRYEISYTDQGNIKTVSNNTSSVEFGFEFKDGKEVVSSELTKNLGFADINLEYSTNSDGLIESIVTPWGSITYQYNSDKRIISQNGLANEDFTYHYTDNKLSLIDGPVVDVKYSYNDSEYISSIDNQVNGISSTKFTLGYNDIGLITSITSTYGTKSIELDANYQLKSLSDSETGSEAFEYDSIGNRTKDNSGSYDYDTKKQKLIKTATHLFTYDNNNNLSSKIKLLANGDMSGDMESYSYNSENQMIEYKKLTGGQEAKIVTFRYDVMGKRIEKAINNILTPEESKTLRYGYVGNEIAAVLNENDILLATYTQSSLRTDDTLAMNVHLAGVGILAKVAGKYYFAKDHLGSIVDVYNSAKSKVQHYIYSSFGKILDIKDGANVSILAGVAVNTLYAFANREFDEEIGLYYNRARYYDAGLGRFLQEDQHPGEISTPLSVINKYIYSFNNPHNFRDPSGLSALSDFVGGFRDGLDAFLRSMNDIAVQIGKEISGFLRSEEFRVILIVTVVVITGGYAGYLVGGGALGVFAGAVVGGLTGAITGGLHAQLSGDDVAEWTKKGFDIGVVVGGVSGYYSGFGMFEAGGIFGEALGGQSAFNLLKCGAVVGAGVIVGVLAGPLFAAYTIGATAVGAGIGVAASGPATKFCFSSGFVFV